MIGALTHGTPRVEYVGSIMRLKDYEQAKPLAQQHWHSYHVKVGPYISRNRNYLTRLFRERTDANWLLMIDHDVVVPQTLLEDLLRELEGEDAGVVVADHVLGTTCPTTALMNHPTDPSMFLAARPPEGLSKKHYVETIASSVVMINRETIERIAREFGSGTWWMHERVLGADGYWEELGEDFSFSKRARAVGVKLLAVYGLDIQHYKVGLVMSSPPSARASAGGK
jgi:hypothetical protein